MLYNSPATFPFPIPQRTAYTSSMASATKAARHPRQQSIKAHTLACPSVPSRRTTICQKINQVPQEDNQFSAYAPMLYVRLPTLSYASSRTPVTIKYTPMANRNAPHASMMALYTRTVISRRPEASAADTRLYHDKSDSIWPT